MAADNDDIISTLNNLIETCKDGQDGFRSAARPANAHPQYGPDSTITLVRARL